MKTRLSKGKQEIPLKNKYRIYLLYMILDIAFIKFKNYRLKSLPIREFSGLTPNLVKKYSHANPNPARCVK